MNYLEENNKTNFIRYFSLEKVSIYLEYGKFNESKAEKLNNWNIVLSETFYSILHYFEVIFRNYCNNKLKKECSEKWYLTNIMYGEHSYVDNNGKKGNLRLKIDEVFKKLVFEKKYIKDISIEEIKQSDIISNLNFGFWTSLFHSNYENTIWNKYLKFIFKQYARKDLLYKINIVKNFRNRVFHHENILKYDLQKIYNLILELIDYISFDMKKKLLCINRFEKEFEKFLYENQELNLGAPLNQ